MKNSEIHGLTTEEVVARINEEKANLTKLKFAHTVSAIENPTRITKVRKDVARLNTELTKRKAEEAKTKAASAESESASE
jgi:large subunit ribosomal protein L29